MARLRVKLLGAFQAHLNEAPLHFAYAKQSALLAYLAMADRRPVTRAKLGLLLWPDKPPSAVQTNLRKVISGLRQLLDQPAPLPPFLLFPQDAVQINPAADMWLDVTTFQARLADCAAHRHRHATSCPTCHAARREACALYRGDFLEDLPLEDSDVFEAWATNWRAELQVQALGAFQALAEYNWQRGRVLEAYGDVEKLLHMDPLHEEGNRLAMLCLAADGRIGQALAHYEHFRLFLQRELGAAPSPATQRLVQALRTEEDGGAKPSHLGGGGWRGRPRNLLPSTLQPLVGRAVELNELNAWLNDPDRRLITVAGLGGIGKTHLALAVAQEQAQVFRDGVVFQALAHIAAPSQVAAALAEAFACPIRPDRPALPQLAAFVGSKDILLILDHCEHLLAVQDDLAQLLQQCPGLVIMLTSRQRLGLPGEWVFPLGGLETPPAGMEATLECYSAANLFVQAATQAGADFVLDHATCRAVGDICRLVNGLPLALILLAAWVRVMPCVELVEELRCSIDVVRSAPQAPGKHQVSLRSVLEQSWQSLEPAERAALAALSVLHGGFDRQSALAVAGAGLDILSNLIDHSLLQVSSEGRYTWHELVHQFAAEQLALAGQSAQAARRHFTYFLAQAEVNAAQIAEFSSLPAFLWFGREQANLDAALTWAAGEQRLVTPDEVGRLVTAVARAGHGDGMHRAPSGHLAIAPDSSGSVGLRK